MSKIEDLFWISQVVIYDDHLAFSRLVQKHQSSLRRFLLNLTAGDKMLTDDLAQETFIKAYLNIKNFQGISNFSTWLFRIAYNTFYDTKRTSKQMESINESAKIIMETDNFKIFEQQIDIYNALKILREEERIALLLCYMENRTQKEVAKIMNLPLGTVKTHILKAKEKMGHYLKNNGYDENK